MTLVTLNMYFLNTLTTTFFSSNRFPESRDNWGTVYPPEDKDPPEFGEEPYREEQASYSSRCMVCKGHHGSFDIIPL